MTTPLLLLPGMMCDARLFAPQLAAIHDRAIMVSPIAAADTTAALARIVLDAAPPRFALAGLSMGAIVAMEVMAQAPEQIAGLCLMDSNPKAEHPEVAAAREPQIQRVRDGSLRAVMRDEMRPGYLADGPNQGAILDTCMAMAETMGPVTFVRQSRALQTRADRRETLSGVKVPALILCGREDMLCPPRRHEMMHELIENSELVVVEGAGHLPTLEQPHVTTRAICHWLEKVDHQ
ncbi:Pimeloyl-ACP methyl ester carboxylesterase [Jannaschia faecimaris]|uniref:Pimeloyl-ACP methyl ester carboxylesterase n=1 Tax=Jannaschia faecimaris TaxID=1244108 RepID=A0A1H3U2Q8_9RHOB|nr:alpha/beta hydrolase [Jannaschia faecimaris]SDZ56774.1 Pimeloyl-ACP methyl ester carboxylesterase [Jannaschia faecimaris]